ncbi:MAG: hypothetical protein J1E83_12685 [Lachnospiraceae bacterium]|nr:hypothetical protein [Lachnospiraceae bacterium]
MVYKWLKCPRCGNEHFIKVFPHTSIHSFPAYCKKCKNEIVISIEPKSRTANSAVIG